MNQPLSDVVTLYGKLIINNVTNSDVNKNHKNDNDYKFNNSLLIHTTLFLLISFPNRFCECFKKTFYTYERESSK